MFSEVKKNNDIFRFDAESNKKQYIDIINTIKHNKFDFIKNFDISIFHPCEIKRSFIKNGCWFFRAQNLRSLYVDEESNPVYISESDAKLLSNNVIKNKDVLMTRSGANYGQCCIYQLNKVAIASSHVLMIRLKNLNPYFFAVFFNTKYGKLQIDKGMYGGSQPEISPYAILNSVIPIFSKQFQQNIETLVKKSYTSLEQSKQLYKQAEDILNKELELDKFESSNNNISIRNFSQYKKVNRLDAEYFQPKYDEIIKLISKHKTDVLINIVDIKKSIEPGSDAYVDEGIPFIRVSDLNKFEIYEPQIKIPKTIEPNIEKLYPKKDTILLSKDGSVGMAYKVEKDLDIVTSGALLHLTVKNKEKVLPDYLTLVLNSLAIQLQAEQSANGAIIKHWKQEDIKNVTIPLLDFKVQKQIAEKIQESFKLRKQSKNLLNLAKQVVEIAIEKNETEALKLIN